MKWRTLLYVTIFLLEACQSRTQNKDVNNQFNQEMKAGEFHQWVLQAKLQCEKEHIKPLLLKEKILERLADDKYTLDSTILMVAHALNDFESRINRNDQKQFAETIGYIDHVQLLLSDRILLKAQLLMLRSEIMVLQSHRESAMEDLSKTNSLLHPLHLEIDKRRIRSMLELAGLFLQSNNKIKAEKLYLDILSYPWTLIEEPEYFHALRDYYIQAGKGLIECRRGNLEALKNIFFVPAVNEILQPILKKAISEAGG